MKEDTAESKQDKIEEIESLNMFLLWPGIRAAIELIQETRYTEEAMDEWTLHRVTNHSLNHAIILKSAVLVEGILDAILRRAILNHGGIGEPGFVKKIGSKDPGDRVKNLRDNIVYNYYKDISRINWTGYDDHFKLVFGKGIKERFNDDAKKQLIYERIKNLFKLRDWLAHGETLGLTFQTKDDKISVELAGKAKELANYLRKEGLYEDNEPHFFNDFFLSNRVADFFHEESLKFIKVIADSLIQQQIPYDVYRIIHGIEIE